MMKTKNLVALAVLTSIGGTAMAQSTFTLYGVVDANLERQKGGTASITKVTSSGLSGSRWGLRGSEDLGSGLKATFILESGFSTDDGTSGQGITPGATAPASITAASPRLFGREAWVGLEGGFGSVRLGRQYTPIGKVADFIGTLPLDVLVVTGTYAASGAYRTDNALNYTTPSFGGLTVAGQYSTGLNGEAPSGNKGGRNFGFNAIYANGPITAAAGVIQLKDVNYTAVGDQKRKEYLLVGGYDFGFTAVKVHYGVTETGTAAVMDAEKMKILGVKAAFPFGNFVITPGLALAKNVKGSGAAPKDDAKLFTLVAAYNLSKRTTVYSRATLVSNDADSNKGFNSPANDKNSNAIQFGMRHTF